MCDVLNHGEIFDGKYFSIVEFYIKESVNL